MRVPGTRGFVAAALLAAMAPCAANAQASAQLAVSVLVIRSVSVPLLPMPVRFAGPPKTEGAGPKGGVVPPAAAPVAGAPTPVIFTDGAPPSYVLRERGAPPGDVPRGGRGSRWSRR